MSKRRRKKPMDYESPLSVLDELGLAESEWQVSADFTKGFQGNRGVVITVTHVPSKVTKRRSVRSTTKRDSRDKAVKLTREMLLDWSSGS